MTTEELRAIARDALQGRRLHAFIIGLLAALMGASVFGVTLNINFKDVSNVKALLDSGIFLRYRLAFLVGGGILALYLLLRLVIGGAATLGYAKYNLDLVDGRETDITQLFSQFHRLWPGFCLQFQRWLYTALWTLLFVIPGLIAQYRYAMAAYILAEHPEITAREAITRSKEMMAGNKFRFFCLSLSYMGWALLCLAPLILLGGIASGPMVVRSTGGVVVLMVIGILLSYGCILCLRPYMEAAYAAFYREVSGTGLHRNMEEESL